MIDRETVDKILDTADIVDVVSDFVSLRRRGANFIGLCPFHDEKTPSFSVSPAKQICHCFGCGRGGSPVNFIMEHEQMSYAEALRYLAKKYHIEIVEKELTSEEKAAQTERESMLVINEFASQYFEDQLFNTLEGKDIGLSYFYERGFNDATIKKFHLGYSPQDSKAFYTAATSKGYNKKYLFDVGLCIDDRRGAGFDRFHGRVMFPVMNIAGKVIAFGGRTLKQTKEVAKYFNSPESQVYVKNRELYGLFQSKRAIVKDDKCFLVEGYTDVISMHQAGIENVVASSGTSLTQGQIRAIHRFTKNVTVLYDGDSAGIHASLRGIDMLLAEGLNIKVLLLPEGEDPDSFARSHSSSELKQYIADNETDFISFKVKILLEGTERDPIKRAAVIGDVVKSIAVIPDAIARSVYAKQCSMQLGIGEDVLLREIHKSINRNREEDYKRRQREKNREEQSEIRNQKSEIRNLELETSKQADQETSRQDNGRGWHNDMIDRQLTTDNCQSSTLYPAELGVMRNIVKYGMCYLCYTFEGSDIKHPTTVVEHVRDEFLADSIEFSHPTFRKMFHICLQYVTDFYHELEARHEQESQHAQRQLRQALAAIDTDGMNPAAIEKREKELMRGFQDETDSRIREFRKNYLEKKLCSHIDDDVRQAALDMAAEKHQLSKIFPIDDIENSLEERLKTIIPEAINNLKNSILNYEILVITEQLKCAQGNQSHELMKRLQELYMTRKRLAKFIGERVVNPKN